MGRAVPVPTQVNITEEEPVPVPEAVAVPEAYAVPVPEAVPHVTRQDVPVPVAEPYVQTTGVPVAYPEKVPVAVPKYKYSTETTRVGIPMAAPYEVPQVHVEKSKVKVYQQGPPTYVNTHIGVPTAVPVHMQYATHYRHYVAEQPQVASYHNEPITYTQPTVESNSPVQYAQPRFTPGVAGTTFPTAFSSGFVAPLADDSK